MLRHSKHMQRAVLGSIALAGALFAVHPVDARAQTASNVDCSKCVDTGDIAKKAVDKKKLAKGAVDSSRIADGAVKAKDLADGAVEESKLEDGAVTGGKIAGGAVTAAKLAPDAVFGRIIVIRTDPLDTIGNCDALQDALADITDNDADNRYLILLEPGIYECDATVAMKSYVDLEGSGRDTTLITGTVVGDGGLVFGADDSELRHLTVDNRDELVDSVIAIVSISVRFRITDVTVVARDSETVTGIVLTGAGATVFTNVTVEAINPTGTNDSEAIRLLQTASAELVDVTARVTDGSGSEDIALTMSNGNTVTTRNSKFVGGDHAAFVQGTANFVSSQLDGGKDPSSTGTFNCVGSYDGAFAPLNSTCD